MRFLTVRDNGRTYHGGTYVDLLHELHSDQLVQEGSDAAYMKAVAKRVKMWDGSRIRTDTVANFLLDLADHGLITLGVAQ